MKTVPLVKYFFFLISLGIFHCLFLETLSGQETGGAVWAGGDVNSGIELYEERIPSSPEAVAAFNLTAELLGQYAAILQSGDPSAYAEFRHYKLDPAIRKVSKLAEQLKDPELLYSAVALASCDEQGEKKGEFWSPALARAIRVFSEKDTKAAMGRLSGEGRERVRKSLLAYLSPSDELRKQLVPPKIDESLEFLDQ
jgi:hypothetical protein